MCQERGVNFLEAVSHQDLKRRTQHKNIITHQRKRRAESKDRVKNNEKAHRLRKKTTPVL
eukprot:scaffold586_cov68-Cylindrotheca_fusiformis.AAC.8